jgi:MFS family permease
MRGIWSRDATFKKFIAARILGQLGTVGMAFYTVYVVRYYHVSEGTAGILTGVMMITQMAFNPFMGWLGDRWNHRSVMAIGMLSAAASATIAIWAPSVGWFYLAYILAGVGFVGFWTMALAMTLEFGEGHEKPTYIGMANTLIAPTAFIIPLLGGWLADTAGYKATFLATILGALATASVLGILMKEKPDTIISEG